MACAPLFAAHNPAAPEWMHALVNAPLPEHDEKTDAVLMYEEENLTVLSAEKTKTVVRRAYKILRSSGREYGTAVVRFNSLNEKVTSIRGWCIPAQGMDYEVRDKEAIEMSPLKDQVVELVTDERVKLLHIPAPDPGNIVGYEYETESRPLILQVAWDFQHKVPVRESHYALNLPSGWEYKAAWLNYPEVKPTLTGNNNWQWGVRDVKEIREEEDMPPWEGVAGQMIVTLFPPGGPAANSLPTWNELGRWELNLAKGRRDPSPEIKRKVAELTASAPTPLARMKALAEFLQHDVRYVGIELGIGGWQPHPAPEVFAHRYGDCKDKATLMSSMLQEIGVDSYYVAIYTRRGSVTPDTPANLAFNHVILAIQLPGGLDDASLIATMQHPRLGKLLFFDPTNELTPFGQIRGHLQANYGLLVTPDGGELVELPMQPSTTDGIQRTAKLTLDTLGTLSGDVQEILVGDRAAEKRASFISATKSADQIKPVEVLLADSLALFHLSKANAINVRETERPFVWTYSFQAESYAKLAGGLLLVRPRVLGRKAQALLETPEPRRYPIEFPGPVKDTDTFDITLPAGYEVDDLPPPTDVDYRFASYHSKTEAHGNVIRYSRTFEVKELSVPVSEAGELKKFYRLIASDERSTAVLKLASR